MEGEQAAMKIFEIVKRNKMLPTNLKELEEIVFVGPSAMQFYRSALNLMDKIGTTEKQRDATLKDGQQIGELILDAEVRLGDLYQAVPKGKGGQKSSPQEGAENLTKPQKIGKSSERISETERIARNPHIVAQVKAEAKARNDIPTKTAVLTHIKNQNLMNELKKVRDEKTRQRILDKEKKPSIDKYLQEVEKSMDNTRSLLAALKGKTQYIESALNKETFKIGLEALIATSEKIRKELT